MTSVFLDTGFVIALEVVDDQHHPDALRHWRILSTSLPKVVTATYILDEVVTFFNRRNHHAKAVEIGKRLISSPSVELIHVDEVLFYASWRYFEQHPDKSYSLTDCISFVVMRDAGIRTALSFDKHFVQAGYKKRP